MARAAKGSLAKRQSRTLVPNLAAPFLLEREEGRHVAQSPGSVALPGKALASGAARQAFFPPPQPEEEEEEEEGQAETDAARCPARRNSADYRKLRQVLLGLPWLATVLLVCVFSAAKGSVVLEAVISAFCTLHCFHDLRN